MAGPIYTSDAQFDYHFVWLCQNKYIEIKKASKPRSLERALWWIILHFWNEGRKKCVCIKSHRSAFSYLITYLLVVSGFRGKI